MQYKTLLPLTFLILVILCLAGCTGHSAQIASPTQSSSDTTDSPTPRMTLDQNGKTVNLKTGQEFLLFLGEGYDWSLSIADQTIISRVMNVMTIRGSQGLFKAQHAGTTTLTASGAPTCLNETPACASPSILFKVTIGVQ